jgi:hypothetical protein
MAQMPTRSSQATGKCAAGVDGGPQIATRTGQQWGGLNATGGLSDNLILRPPGLSALIAESV